MDWANQMQGHSPVEPSPCGRVKIPRSGFWGGVAASKRPPAALQYGGTNAVEVVHYVTIRSPKDHVALRLYPTCAGSVANRNVKAAVVLAIHLDHQSLLGTEKIDDERAKRCLTAKAQSFKPTIAQSQPKPKLSRRERPPHSTRQALVGVRNGLVRHADPSPKLLTQFRPSRMGRVRQPSRGATLIDPVRRRPPGSPTTPAAASPAYRCW